MKRALKGAALAAALSLTLSGCLATIGAGIAIGTTMYCAGVSEAGKEVIRDVATAGKKIIACESPAAE